jgi:hypothetical protein
MKTHRKIFTLVLSILLFTSFKKNDEVHIRYPYEVGVVNACEGNEDEIQIEIETESIKKIKVHSFELGKSNFIIFIENKIFKASDTLLLTKDKPIKMKVKYKIQPSTDTVFTFKTDQDNYLNNRINIFYGQKIITRDDVRSGKEQFIRLLGSCQDSIKVFFPYGGTISSVNLYNDTTNTEKEFKSIYYGVFDPDNFINFTKADTGRYFVQFSACYWGGEFWLNIK